MLKIQIADRLKWFSHLPGVICCLLGTSLKIQCFPSKILVGHVQKKEFFQEIPFLIEGPVEGFTVEQDLEKGTLRVFGKAKSGFYEFWIGQREGQVFLSSQCCFQKPQSQEKLSLGVHKAHQWEKMQKRLDLAEIFPFWLKMGQELRGDVFQKKEDSLLGLCQKENQSKELLTPFKDLFLAGFDSFLIPRAIDTQYHGFSLPPIQEGDCPLQSLFQGAFLIRRLFFRQEQEKLTILPHLPPAFHCGKMIQIKVDSIGTIDFEWSKKQIKKVILRTAETPLSEVSLFFKKELKSCRLDRQKRKELPLSMKLAPNTIYTLDNFQK